MSIEFVRYSNIASMPDLLLFPIRCTGDVPGAAKRAKWALYVFWLLSAAFSDKTMSNKPV
jgi:hypothetical protein